MSDLAHATATLDGQTSLFGATVDASPVLPESIVVKRSDPVYMAHAYLTKVPVTAVMPFIEAMTQPGDTVLDPFAGSGMTGVAALATGRSARLFDVSVLGRHIGTNYTQPVESGRFRAAGQAVTDRASEIVGDIYGVRCESCGGRAETAKTIWSSVHECESCHESVVYFEALRDAGWLKAAMACHSCGGPISSRSTRIRDEPVIDAVACACGRKQREQRWSEPLQTPQNSGADWPDMAIDVGRQMYQASALGRHGLTTTAAFYSQRNLHALAALRDEIEQTEDRNLASKLRFAFTAILTRASKRYQWSPQRPLNAANANYYVAPVFYDWNVFHLYSRKLESVVRSDAWIRARRRSRGLAADGATGTVSYEVASATALPLGDGTVDYIFTDPPFGSNIFYSDMNLFQEAWLPDGEITDPQTEAVVDRVDTGSYRSPERYESMLAAALGECRRVLKPGGKITLLFGNSNGGMWQLLQRSIAAAGLAVVPELIATLDKGQRSVKGLASGFEYVATADLMLTMTAGDARPVAVVPSPDEIDALARSVASSSHRPSPSQCYVEVLREGIRRNWDLSCIDLKSVTRLLREANYEVDRQSGELRLLESA